MAWHSYERELHSLAPVGEPDAKGRYLSSLEVNYTANLSASLPTDTYEPTTYGSGLPLSLNSTQLYDPERNIVQHFEKDLLRYRKKNAQGSYCGSSVFSGKRRAYLHCLWKSPSPPPPSTVFPKRFAVGNGFACFARKNGSVKCWGSQAANGLFQNPAIGDRFSSFVPIAALTLTGGVSHLNAGHSTICALVNGTAKCWGQNLHSVLVPSKEITEVKSPTEISGLSGSILGLSMGKSFKVLRGFTQAGSLTLRGKVACAIVEGWVKCWGGGRGYLADGTWGTNFNENEIEKATPIKVPGLPAGATAISVGYDVSCAIIQGAAWCWGGKLPMPYEDCLKNDPECNRKLTVDDLKPIQIRDLSAGVTSIAVDYNHACAVQNGRVKCWGANETGELGNGTLTNSEDPVLVNNLLDFQEVTLGKTLSCAVGKNTFWCWGSFGSLEVPQTSPTKILDLSEQILYAEAGTPTCVSTESEKIYCFDGRGAEVGSASWGDAVSCTEPILTRSVEESEEFKEYLPPGKDFKDLKSVSKIATGANHSCAIIEGGSIRCWGRGDRGQLGNGTREHSRTPVRVSGLTNATAISLGGEHSCAIVEGSVKCWGNNAAVHGHERNLCVLGDNSSNDDSVVPVAVQSLSNATHLASGSNHNCAISNGALWCWGQNDFGQLGNGSTTDSKMPTLVKGLDSGVSAVSLGSFHSCAIHQGSAKCWGKNDLGQLGNQTKVDSPSPVLVSGLDSEVSVIAAGHSHSCAIHKGVAKCWGGLLSAALGDGRFGNEGSTTPVQVIGLDSKVSALALGKDFSCALMEGGAVKCWGVSEMGQLGVNGWYSEGSFSSPQPVQFLPANATAIASGTSHTCAISGGRPYCWGYDTLGEVGNRKEVAKFAHVVTVPILVPILE